jgi:hypothetical protein
VNATSQPRSTRSKVRILAVLPLVLLLSGCIRLNMDLKVNDDSTVSGTIVFAVSDALAGMGSGSTSSDLGTSPLVDQKAKGVTEIPYKQDGFTGQKFMLNHTPLTALQNGTNKEGNLAIVRKGNQIRVTGLLDLTSSGQGTADPLGALTGGIATSMFASADLRISITVPGKIVKSTGVISNGGKTVTWRPKIGEKTDLATTVDLPMVPWTLIGGGVALLLALLVAFIVMRSRRRSPALPPALDSSSDEENPSIQTELF